MKKLIVFTMICFVLGANAIAESMTMAQKRAMEAEAHSFASTVVTVSDTCYQKASNGVSFDESCEFINQSVERIAAQETDDFKETVNTLFIEACKTAYGFYENAPYSDYLQYRRDLYRMMFNLYISDDN